MKIKQDAFSQNVPEAALRILEELDFDIYVAGGQWRSEPLEIESVSRLLVVHVSTVV